MVNKDCSMCAWYNMKHEYCRRFRENHLPSDGEDCLGWEYWEDADERERNEQQGEWEPL